MMYPAIHRNSRAAGPAAISYPQELVPPMPTLNLDSSETAQGRSRRIVGRHRFGNGHVDVHALGPAGLDRARQARPGQRFPDQPGRPANQQVRVDIMDPTIPNRDVFDVVQVSSGGSVLQNVFITSPNTPRAFSSSI